MIYKFAYFSSGELFYKTCYTEREAEIFFSLLVASKCSIKVTTITRRAYGYGEK